MSKEQQPEVWEVGPLKYPELGPPMPVEEFPVSEVEFVNFFLPYVVLDYFPESWEDGNL